MVSVNLPLQTWLGLVDAGISDSWPMGLMGRRPHNNIGQPNQLATLLLWGLLDSGWAYVDQKIRSTIVVLMSCFLLLVIGLTQSRTGWLQIGLLIVRAIAMRAQADLRFNRPQLAMLGVLFAAGVLRGFAVTMLWSGVTHL